MVEAEAFVNLSGQMTHVLVVGECKRDFTRKVTCEIKKVFAEEGDVNGFISERDRVSLEAKLVATYLSDVKNR